MTISDLYEIYCQHPVVTTDTRDCPEDSIFFALRGTSFNGNDFALKALEAGCAYAVVDDEAVTGNNRLIHVDDVLKTLQDLATCHRRRLRIPVIQITGTNGKTTTKELLSAVLSQKYNVLYTLGNFNNHIGVPKTLLRLRPEHEIAVIETGANHPGEIRELSHITDADCGLITNVGKAHLEGFGSFEGVIRTKGELYDYLRQKESGFIFLHADNEYLRNISGDIETFTYGMPGKGYDVEGEVMAGNPFLHLRWRPAGGEWQEVETHLVGGYNLDNVLAAAAAGIRFGISPTQISQALAAYEPTNNRSELKKTERNELIIDAYNANPTSMKAALDNFRLMPANHKMAILGEMRELGDASPEEHRHVVELVGKAGCEEVWLVGDNFRPFAGTYRVFDNVEAVRKHLEDHPVSGRLILIKGSNGTRLFRLPELL